MPNTTISELGTLVEKLQEERQGHLNAIAEIDAAFDKLGIVPTETKRSGKAPAKKVVKKSAKKSSAKSPLKPKKATGKRYPKSGSESILDVVRKAGKAGISGGNINKYWKSEGRAGSAYNIIGQLVKAKKLKRHDIKGQRGSQYTTI